MKSTIHNSGRIMQKKYPCILVPFDGSEFSKRALDEAIQVSKIFGSKLFVVMAVNEPITEPPGMFFGMIRGVAMDKAKEDYVDEAFYRANHILQETAEYCRKKRLTVNYEVLKGHPADAILEFSKKKDIGLIIMGNKGHHGVRKLKILGIVSRHVVENATCPVMIVH